MSLRIMCSLRKKSCHIPYDFDFSRGDWGKKFGGDALFSSITLWKKSKSERPLAQRTLSFFRFFLDFDHKFSKCEVGVPFFFFFFDFFKPKILEQLQNFSQEHKLISKFNLKIFKNTLEKFSKLVVLKFCFEAFTCKIFLDVSSPNCILFWTMTLQILFWPLTRKMFLLGCLPRIFLMLGLVVQFFLMRWSTKSFCSNVLSIWPHDFVENVQTVFV